MTSQLSKAKTNWNKILTKTFSFLPLILALLIIITLIKPYTQQVDTFTNKTCYEKVCTKTTLDQFDNCKDGGIEDTGFLSSEHYYICDGNKVVKDCLEYIEVRTNKTYMDLTMRCEFND